MELKLAGEAMDSRNKVMSEASKFFFVTTVFVCTIVPIPIPCAGLLLEAGLICLLGGTEGGCPNADAEWGLVLSATTGGRVRMRSVNSTLEGY